LIPSVPAETAVEQANLIRSRQVKPTELVTAYLARIQMLDSRLNSFVTVASDQALLEARQKERTLTEGGDLPPYHGVPIAIKDLDDTAGIRTTYSHSGFASFVPDQDSAVVARIKAAGFIILGKTNVPEFGAAVTTESQLNGPCHNPWQTDYSSGGSSGGSAAAVAAGLVSVGHASDGAGSIRIPASCCGLVGLKPSRGRISLAPGPGIVLEGASTQGVVTRTVRDTAAMLDVMQGYEVGDPYWLERVDVNLAISQKPKALRIALSTISPTGSEVHPECVAAAQAAADLLAALGHNVEEATPDWRVDGLVDLQRRFYSTCFPYNRRFDPVNLEPDNKRYFAEAMAMSSVKYVECWVDLQNLCRRIVAFWNQFDLLLTPTLGTPPKKLGEGLDLHPDDLPLWGFHHYIPFLPIANLTGQPAITLPLHWSESGLPVGVQLMGPPAGEATLLSIAAQVEEASPWATKYRDVEESLYSPMPG
jgi:amidase